MTRQRRRLILLASTSLSALALGGAAPVLAACSTSPTNTAAVSCITTVAPGGFQQFTGLSAPNTNALTRLDGEAATGAERGALLLMDDFLTLLLDPFTNGRTIIGPTGGATGFAPPGLPSGAPGYMPVKSAPGAVAPTFDQRWYAWGAGFGRSGTANGDPTIGSTTVTASTFAYAAGMDYRIDAGRSVGFALAGGGVGWNLAQGLGSGRGDSFLAGIYGRNSFGPGYLGAALAFGNHWFETDRTSFDADRLTSRFDGQSFGARVEAGWRFAVAPGLGMTPYGVFQAQTFHTESHDETDLTGGGFALDYDALSATDTRAEVGGRFDQLTYLGSQPLLLRGRLAYAHDWVTDPSLGAAFVTLPGSNFLVTGAEIPRNSAIIELGAELKIDGNWSFMTKFDGQFATGAQILGGTGVLRYTW